VNQLVLLLNHDFTFSLRLRLPVAHNY